MTKGLSSVKAEELLKIHGQNVIQEQKKEGLLLRFLAQFNNFLTFLLGFAALISIGIGETFDGALIIAIVVLNAFFGFFQEKKAEESLQALKKITRTTVRVVRDGKQIEIESRFLVPSDIVFLEEGLKVPADCRVLDPLNLEVNEAALTGESIPVSKEQGGEIFMGTIVAKGRSLAEVFATGDKTKFGQIAQEMINIKEEQTPLQKKLNDLTRLIGIIGVVAACAVFGLTFWQGSTYFPAFLLAVSLAVAIVPEGLPAVMTITLAIGVKEMAKRKSIIRKLSAIEGLGAITLIATDKTGTLTTNEMKVKDIWVDEKIYSEEDLPSLSNNPFSKILLNSILCSTASLVRVHDHDSYDVLGDPTEGALLFLSQKAGLVPDQVRKEWEIVEEKPFDSLTKTMTVKVKRDNQFLSFTKGAPESILSTVDKILIGHKEEALTPAKRRKIEKIMEDWAASGLRLIGFSNDSVFLGLVAIHDPPRPEVKEALAKARSAGIKVVMITGDNEKTAEAIGVSVGLIAENDEIMTGKQLDEYTDDELLEHLKRVRVFARITPEHKYKIVRLYQKMGEIVAVTGDGVNDAIALKQADVGIAMGKVGTDVARETADMIITDDNFASIIDAVEEGRNIIKNLKNSIKYLLAGNTAEAIALIGALSIGIPNIFLPVQILYINLISDGFPALALAWSTREEGVMRRPPAKVLQLLNRFDKFYIFTVGSAVALVVILSYFLFGKTGAFSVLAMIQSFIFMDLWLSHRFSLTHLKKFQSGIFITAFLMPFILQFAILKIPYLNRVFHVVAVPWNTFLQFIFISALIVIGVELIKKILPK